MRLRSVILSFIVIVLSACGFHLRGWDLETSIESAFVAAKPRNTLAGPLRRALAQAGVRLTEGASQAAVVIELLDQRREYRSVSVTRGARAAEYELMLGAYFTIRADGQALSEPRWVEVERAYSIDRDNIVGSSEEAALIEEELRADLIQQIVRSLNAVMGAHSAS